MTSTIAESASHVVQFYQHDEALIPGVASYLAEALRVGGTVVVVAEPGHRDALDDALTARGTDLAAARRGGAIVELDAADTLDRFNTSAGLDRARFDRVIGDLIRSAEHRGGPVRAYGEMVGLLWNRGQPARALALEALWNQLATTVPFGLYCGYQLPAAAGPTDAVRHVSDLHTAVHGPHLPDALIGSAEVPDVVQFYDPDMHSPAMTRALVRDVLERWHDHALIEDALLVVSELASNAVQHAGSGFHVALSRTVDTVRITVGDSHAAPPVPRGLTSHRRSGRGLHLVDSLTRRWGYTPNGAGKAVWAELARSAAFHNDPR